MVIKFETFPPLEEKKDDIESSHLEQKNWCELAERLFVESGELGYGQTANVYNSTSESGMCLKRINQQEYRKFPFMNNLEDEAKFLEEVADLVDENDNVIIPQPFMVINSEKKEKVTKENLKGEMVTFEQRVRESVLVMERIDGPSLEDIFDPKEPRFKKDLPEGIDLKKFFDDLQSFVEKMNEHDIHHRDLHMGNIMIDEETHKPVIIDFGFSRKKMFDGEDVYRDDIHPEYIAQMKRDLTQVEKHRKYILTKLNL